MLVKHSGPHRVCVQDCSDYQNNKHPYIPCLPRPVALQVAGEGTTPPLRKTTTNLTSVTVSTGHAAFLLLVLPQAPPFPVLP